MALTTGAFLNRFPEFAETEAGLVSSAIAEALENLNATAFGELLDEAQGYLAAHKLAVSPFGRSARLSSNDGTSTYLGEFRRIKRMVSPRFMVT